MLLSSRARALSLICVLTGVCSLLAWTQDRRRDPVWGPRFVLEVVDIETDEPLAARFTVFADGREHAPRWVSPHGLRFVSVHRSKRQSLVATFTRGSGPVEVPLPPGTKQVEVHVAKGFDYLPATVRIDTSSDPVAVKVRLRRWNRLHEEGWRAADTHVHYDRIEPSANRDWMDMMDADDLTFAEFMTLKGGQAPRVWARQYAYGRAGEGAEGQKLIVPGEEYRDSLQGHILLFRIRQIIQPILAGYAVGSPHNWPAFLDVLLEARSGGALVGAAHGGVSGASPTGVADAVLGGVDFWEIRNARTWELDLWYKLANCGYVLPPTAGTDLPNDPYRDPWQPFLGSIRTYVRVGDAIGSDVLHSAISGGEVFVSSGPIVGLAINGSGPGDSIRLPATGGEIEIEARLESPLPLQTLEVIRNGKPLEVTPEMIAEGEVNGLRIQTRLHVDESSWFAARGAGGPIEALGRNSVAHTAGIRVLGGERPIHSAESARELISLLNEQKDFYRQNGSYADPAHRSRMLEILDLAISKMAREASLRTQPGRLSKGVERKSKTR